MKDAAAKIAKYEYQIDQWSEDDEVARAKAFRPRLERAIRSAIRRAVKAERERCCGIAQRECNKDLAWIGRTAVTRKIIAAINTPAKKRPSKRKGRR